MGMGFCNPLVREHDILVFRFSLDSVVRGKSFCRACVLGSVRGLRRGCSLLVRGCRVGNGLRRWRMWRRRRLLGLLGCGVGRNLGRLFFGLGLGCFGDIEVWRFFWLVLLWWWCCFGMNLKGRK